MPATAEVLAGLPQRPPFLFIDSIVSRDDKIIKTEKKMTGDEDFFKGHFPNLPIMPGVLLCENMFQTGALLIGGQGTEGKNIGVVSRIQGAKFKNFAKPGDLLETEVELKEVVMNAYFMKGKVKVDGKLIASCDFSCALVPQNEV